MEKWFILNNYETYKKIATDGNFTDLQKRILANRELTSESEKKAIFSNSIEDLYSPFELKNMKSAIEIFMEAIRQRKKILIVGDYDQDGVAATVILYKAIKLFYQDVDYAIPDRIEDGYGLNTSIVEKAKEDGYELIITCDNGIAAFQAVKFSKDLGMTVIVTDHHEPAKKDGKDLLVDADAIINPHLQDDHSSFKEICGASVAFKFVLGLTEMYGHSLGIDKNYIYKLSQFAALGTISDMMPLVDENRILVRHGLELLSKRENLGVKALLEELQWDKDVSVYTVGFLIGPSVNSSGRLYTARLGVELFIDSDINNVKEYAKTLVELNNERKQLTNEAIDIAIKRIEDEKLYNNDIIVLYEKSTHESICGLVAGRIKDRYNRPTIILTSSSKDDIIKGSGRSIPSYNMFEELNEIRDIFEAFGGHAMACGLSIDPLKLDKFSRLLNEKSKLKKEDFIKEVNIDDLLTFNMINRNMIKEIDQLRPFGLGFAEPIFASRNVEVMDAKILGQNRNVLKLILRDKNNSLEAIAFNLESLYEKFEDKYNFTSKEDLLLLKNKIVDIVYKLTINEFMGQSNIQLNIVTMR